jgi:O-antigen/teichoic acid export membrane protein
VRGHVSYGLRSLVSGVLIEVNSRVDVWMLGRYTTNAAVGVYGTALQVAEGVFQVLIALQNNYNPVMARHLAARRHEELEQVVRRGGRRTFVAMAALTLLVVAAYPLALRVLMLGGEFTESWTPFALLMAGIWLSSIRMPFFQVLLMAGRPGWHSLFMLAVVGVNAALNAVLIPALGIRGAALATGLSFVASVALLRLAARRLVGVRL